MILADVTPGSEFWDWEKFSKFVQVVGVPTLFALAFFAALAWMWWKSQKSPVSNAEQMKRLRWMTRASVSHRMFVIDLSRKMLDLDLAPPEGKAAAVAAVRDLLDKAAKEQMDALQTLNDEDETERKEAKS